MASPFNYKNNRPFDPRKTIDAPEADRITDYLMGELEKVLGKPRVEKKRRDFRNKLKRLILDLHVAHGQNPRMVLRYSRRKNEYLKWESPYRKAGIPSPR